MVEFEISFSDEILNDSWIIDELTNYLLNYSIKQCKNDLVNFSRNLFPLGQQRSLLFRPVELFFFNKTNDDSGMEDGKPIIPRPFELTRSRNTTQTKAKPNNFDIYATTWD